MKGFVTRKRAAFISAICCDLTRYFLLEALQGYAGTDDLAEHVERSTEWVQDCVVRINDSWGNHG